MRQTWTFHSAASLIFGPGAVAQLGDVARRLHSQRALVITDVVLERVGIVEQAVSPLRSAGVDVQVWNGGEPEPSLTAAARAIAAAGAFRPDVLVGLGGGSNMDLAKITATVLAHGKTPRDWLGDDIIPGPVWPLICVPTTSGTGSEVSAASVLTDTENQLKIGALSNFLRPAAAVVDPILTLGSPAKVTADSGIDALTHAIEAYTAVDNATFPLPPGERSVYQGRHPIGDAMAERAIRLIGANLRTAVHEPGNVAAREAMALGATLAGLAFSNVGVAAVHALEYPVGGATHCSHGAGNGLLLPFVMRFNLPVRTVEMARIAELLGEDIGGLNQHAAAERAIAAIESLKRDIGIPTRLRELGVRLDQLRGFAEKAFGIKRILRVNPRPVTVEDLHDILLAAL